jgi:hypothetical protein
VLRAYVSSTDGAVNACSAIIIALWYLIIVPYARCYEDQQETTKDFWRDIESLLKACGARILEGDGSAIRVVLGKQRVFIHRPHPHKEAKGYQMKVIKELLEANGIRP